MTEPAVVTTFAGTPRRRGYASGRQFEHRCRHALEAAGWVVLRMAGSKGACDLVAIRPGTVALVQCKRDPLAFGPGDWSQLWALAFDAGALAVLVGDERRKLAWYRLLGPKQPRSHSRPWEPWSPSHLG